MDNVIALPLPPAASLTFAQVADAHMLAYRGRCATHASRVRFWKAHLADTPPTEVTPEQIDAGIAKLEALPQHYAAGMRKDGSTIYKTRKGALAQSTIRRYFTVLQSIFAFARKRRLLPRGFVSPCTQIHLPPDQGARLRYLNADEYARLLIAARASHWPRLYLLIALAVTTGARKGTLLALRWRDVDLQRAQAYVQRTKNDAPHVLVLIPSVLEEMRRFAGKPDQLVFASPRKPQRAFSFEKCYALALADARIEGACFHTLRHSHASWLAQNGASLLEIAESMGHRSLSMVKRYAHLCVDRRAVLLNKVFA